MQGMSKLEECGKRQLWWKFSKITENLNLKYFESKKVCHESWLRAYKKIFSDVTYHGTVCCIKKIKAWCRRGAIHKWRHTKNVILIKESFIYRIFQHAHPLKNKSSLSIICNISLYRYLKFININLFNKDNNKQIRKVEIKLIKL